MTLPEIMLFRFRLWLMRLLVRMAEAVAPESVQAERERRSLNPSATPRG